MFWQPVRLAADLQPGRALPIRIMSEDFTLYRGEARPDLSRLPEGVGADGAGEGRPHLVAFRCAHRGTRLSTGWLEGDNLRCFYHGWAYEGTGGASSSSRSHLVPSLSCAPGAAGGGALVGELSMPRG